MNIFERPIPDLSELRELGKQAYRAQPIDPTNSLYGEPVVDVADYGIVGASYYSQPNRMTGQPLPGIRPQALVRQTVAEKLAKVNSDLETLPEIRKVFGGPAEIVVRDALRSHGLQQYIHDVVWPAVLKEHNPDWTDEQIAQELPKFVAKPSDDLSRPTPHMTGGAVDLNICLKSGDTIDVGHNPGKVTSLTDYHEGYKIDPEFAASHDARLARRALYNVLNEHGFVNNPTEWWHYSYGDQMWALYKGEPYALYGAITDSPDIE